MFPFITDASSSVAIKLYCIQLTTKSDIFFLLLKAKQTVIKTFRRCCRSMSVLKKFTPILFLGIIARKSHLIAACSTTQLPLASSSSSSPIANSFWSQQSKMSSTQSAYAAYAPGSSSICYVTTPNEESAKKIARLVISNKLAACVNIIPNIQSIYEWEGRINEDLEYLLMIKTTTEHVDELIVFVRDNHPYSVAEVISVKIENGNPPYLDWVAKSVKK